MNPSAEENGNDENKMLPTFEDWTKSGRVSKLPKNGDQLPLERAVVNMASIMVLEDESGKWDAISSVASDFNQLGDDLEAFNNNFLFQKDLNDPYRKEAPEKIASHMQNLVERIEQVHESLDLHRDVLGDLVVGLLRHALNILQERAGQIRNAAIEENPVKLKGAYKLFENFRNKFFSELSQVLSTYANDPFARADSGPFEKETTDMILDALKVPAMPEAMLAKYMQNDKKIDDETFKKDYRFFMNVELSAHKAEIEEEINMKRAETEKNKQMLENVENRPELSEAVMKEYNYWQKMSPEKRYKQLLRLRAFELLKLSAGKKRVAPEDMYKLYSEMKYVD